MNYYDGMTQAEVVHEIDMMAGELDDIHRRRQELDLEERVVLAHRREAIRVLGMTTINNYWTTERPRPHDPDDNLATPLHVVPSREEMTIL